MKKFHVFLIASWVIAVSAVITILHSWHYADLGPGKNKQVEFKNLLPKIKEGHGVAHFITPACSCSQQVYKHLLSRKPLENELAIIIDDNELEFEKNLKAKGYKVQLIETKKLDAEKADMIKGVPLLVIYDNNLETQYVGGYSDKSITPFTKINIQSFLNNIEKKRKIASMPVIGCAVSKKYQKLLDPLGLKYQE